MKNKNWLSSSDWLCDYTLNNIVSLQECLKKCGRMSYKNQISGSLIIGVSLSEHNTDEVFAHVRDVCTFLQRTAIIIITVTFLLNPSKVDLCVRSCSCD